MAIAIPKKEIAFIIHKTRDIRANLFGSNDFFYHYSKRNYKQKIKYQVTDTPYDWQLR